MMLTLSHSSSGPEPISGHHYLPSKGVVASCLLVLTMVLAGCGQTQIATSSVSHSAGSAGPDAQPETAAVQGDDADILPALPPSLEGAFLAARQAVYNRDIEQASQFFDRTVSQDSQSRFLLTQNFITHYQSGQLEKASVIARQLERQNIELPLASEPAIATAIINQDWMAVIALTSKMEAHQASIELAILLRAYAHFGAGQPEQGYGELAKFTRLSADTFDEMPAYHRLQHAYFAELDGQTDVALQHYRDLADSEVSNGYLNLQIASGLWRMGAYQQSRTILTDKLPLSFNSSFILNQFQTGRSPLISDPSLSQFVARTLLEMSWFSESARNEGFLLPRARLALSLWPEFDAAHYIVGLSYSELGKPEQARRQLDIIGNDSAWYQQRLYVLIDLAQDEYDFQSARLLLRSYLDELTSLSLSPQVRQTEISTLTYLAGNIERYDGKCGDAIPFYQRALEISPDRAVFWRNLAICYEQTEQDEKAEGAFLTALELDPDDAVGLNYLGYWWADEGRRLDEAVAYIQKAVNLQPQSGYYADSLGWVYYRQGKFKQAVIWLEKAVQLAPDDAIIFDHLGDAYWQVGRYHEARYKWRYAINVGGLTEDEDRVTRQKLQYGLAEAEDTAKP